MTPAWYRWGLAAAVAAMPLYLWRFSLAGIPTNFFEIGVAVLVVSGLVSGDVRRHWREAEHELPRMAAIAIGLFILAALVSASIAKEPRVSFGIFKSWVIIPLLLGWLVYSESVKNEQGKLSIEKSLIFSGTVVALISLIYFQWGQRLAGLYDVPNSLALYLAPLLILAAAKSAASRFYTLAAALMFLALLATQSLAGLAVIAFVSVLLFRRCPHDLAVAAAVLVLGAGYLVATGRMAYITQPLTQGTPNSVSVRWQLWSVSGDLIRQHPLLGVGLGQFEPAYQAKLHERFSAYSLHPELYNQTPPLPEFVYRDPHNFILSFWLNTGLLGVLSFVGVHGWLFWKTRSSLATSYQLRAAAVALSALLLFGLVDTIYWKNDLAALQWVLIALIIPVAQQASTAARWTR